MAEQKQPFTVNIDNSKSRFFFPELRFAIARARALTRDGGISPRATITYHDDDDVTQLGVVVLGEWFPAQKPASFEELTRAMVHRGFAFHFLESVTDRIQAETRKLGISRGWESLEVRALSAAEDIIEAALERVTDEMDHSERTAHYKVARLTERL